MFNSKDYVEKDLEFQEKLKKIYTQQLKGLPEGGLSVEKRGDKTYYYKRVDSKKIYLSKGQHNEVIQLQKRKFIQTSIKIVEGNIPLMKNFLAGYQSVDPNRIQAVLPDAYGQLPNECFSLSGASDSRSWGNKRYRKNNRYTEGLVHRTMKGEFVRSKSEAMVANMMFTKKIPYHYEEIISVGDKEIAADFNVLVASENKTILLEHIGMLSDPKYFEQFLWKVAHYLRNGYIPWQDVIFTFDDKDGHIDTELIEKIIETFLV